MNHKPNNRCQHCYSHRASFKCVTCGKQICMHCVYVVVVSNLWKFYCSFKCAPYQVDAREYDDYTPKNERRIG